MERLPVTKYVTLRMPEAHWDQIVDDIENMCGGSDEIEILSDVTVLVPSREISAGKT